jgi:spore coat polysaccharide biosynthesis predicted glycosyltransferase SpsG
MLVVDDLADRVLHGDIVLNQNVGAEDLPIRTGPHTELLLGPRYALLRPEFAAKRPAALASVESIPDRPRTVLVLMGGTDPTKSSLTVALACKDAFPEADVTAVSPSIAGSPSEVVRVVSRVEDVATAMAATDLVVTAAGSTLWEVCCLARPAAALRVAENQRDVYGRLTTAGVVHGLGGVPVDRKTLAERLRAMTAGTGALRRLAAAGASLVDGLGAQRVVDKLDEHMEGRFS